MSEYKEFQGKTLDAAIAEACEYFNAPREKLEIEIVEDAKSGIFGLVGARKATINARRVQLPALSAPAKGRGKKTAGQENTEAEVAAATEATVDQPQDEATQEGKAETKKGKKTRSGPAKSPEQEVGAPAAPEESLGEKTTPERKGRPTKKNEQATAPRKERRSAVQGSEDVQDGDSQELSLPKVALADLDQAKLSEVSLQVVKTLVEPIVGEAPIELQVTEDRVMLQIQADDTGLLIGREGQNLAAVQYLAARIISRLMEAQVRVQVDAGDYHSRQDTRLRDMATSLAERVRTTGKSMSTKPLSAYQRRVIHLTLQEDPDIYTRSTGDGPLKRVVVMRRKD